MEPTWFLLRSTLDRRRDHVRPLLGPSWSPLTFTALLDATAPNFRNCTLPRGTININALLCFADGFPGTNPHSIPNESLDFVCDQRRVETFHLELIEGLSLDGSLLDPSWNPLGTLSDPPWIADGSMLDPSWSHLGSLFDPTWIADGSMLGPSWNHLGSFSDLT